MTGRRRSPRPIFASAKAPRRGRSSPSTTSPSRETSRRRSFRNCACRAEAFGIDGVEYYGGVGFLKGGLQFADADHHGEPDLCRGNLHAGGRHGPRRRPQGARQCPHRHRQRHRYRCLEPGERRQLARDLHHCAYPAPPGEQARAGVAFRAGQRQLGRSSASSAA